MVKVLSFFNTNDNNKKLTNLIKSLERNNIKVEKVEIQEFKNIYHNEIKINSINDIMMIPKRKNIFFIDEINKNKIAVFRTC